jgi:hypothetical protein
VNCFRELLDCSLYGFVLDAVKEDVSDLQVSFVPSYRRFEALGMRS